MVGKSTKNAVTSACHYLFYRELQYKEVKNIIGKKVEEIERCTSKSWLMLSAVFAEVSIKNIPFFSA